MNEWLTPVLVNEKSDDANITEEGAMIKDGAILQSFECMPWWR